MTSPCMPKRVAKGCQWTEDTAAGEPTATRAGRKTGTRTGKRASALSPAARPPRRRDSLLFFTSTVGRRRAHPGHHILVS
jgi:hypothetical protein